eukprot:m.218486 g.218486  ORF g.218486 m.218486 type:complete len:76 (+) comp39898_c0_seq24:868-1095(+)
MHDYGKFKVQRVNQIEITKPTSTSMFLSYYCIELDQIARSSQPESRLRGDKTVFKGRVGDRFFSQFFSGVAPNLP